jgi:CheY-like chemotaxis protein
VEDSPDNQVLIQSYLKNTIHRVDLADNGQIGVAKFQNGHYDLILMDMQMPVMDGLTATRTIRRWEQEQGASPQFKSLPSRPWPSKKNRRESLKPDAMPI